MACGRDDALRGQGHVLDRGLAHRPPTPKSEPSTAPGRPWSRAGPRGLRPGTDPRASTPRPSAITARVGAATTRAPVATAPRAAPLPRLRPAWPRGCPGPRCRCWRAGWPPEARKGCAGRPGRLGQATSLRPSVAPRAAPATVAPRTPRRRQFILDLLLMELLLEAAPVMAPSTERR